MDLRGILAELDAEIARLKQARTVLAGGTGKGTATATKRDPKAAATTEKPGTKKRKLTPEGRKRIAEAVRRRWALQKKAAAK